jgi:hypothetical protein
MGETEKKPLQAIYQFFFKNRDVTEDELKKEFGDKFEKLLDAGEESLAALGFSYYIIKDEDDVRHFILGTLNESPLPEISEKTLSVFFVAAYIIWKQPGQRILLDELNAGFTHQLGAINDLLKTLKYLTLKENFVYISPLGKYVLANYLEDSKIIQIMENFIE